MKKICVERRRKVKKRQGICLYLLGSTEQLALRARMSVLNQSGEEQVECPLCMEPLEVDDLHFYPCTCGYQICRFCWNRIREGENGLCPACRKAYPENPADFTPLSQEQVAAIKTEKKAREQKRRNKTLESRRALANVRVVQNNLVFVVGLPVRLADPEILKRQEYFGKYGKIHKVVINQSTAYAGSQGPSASAYVTYVSPSDALRAIQGVNNVTLDGRVLKGSLGTTKYCANFMKNQPCPKPDCMYLHELGDPKASFTKEEMHAGLHQVYERRLHTQLLQRDRPDRGDEKQDGSSSTNAENGSKTKDGNQSNFIPTTVVTSSQINVVSTSKSKKETVNGTSNNQNGNSNGNTSGNGNGNSNSNSNGKEAWPSLACSPPADSPKRPSPEPHAVNSQENGTSESSSPTLQTQQSQTKHKENHTDTKSSRSNKDSNHTNGISKKSKEGKSKQKNSNSITQEPEPDLPESKPEDNSIQNSVFENDSQSYLSNELDELESDRHSLLENHDLLDNSDHSLLDDDTHNLLNDANNEVMMMQRHKEMLAGLVDNHLIPQMKPINGYGLLDRDTYLTNDRPLSHNPGLMDQKELMRSRNLLMRQNEMLARQHNVMVEPKHYMPTPSIGLESASELLGANFHPNHNMLPPFGMRVDNSMGSSALGNIMTNTLTANSLNNPITNTLANSMGTNSMSANSMGNTMGNTMGNSLANSMGNSMGAFMLRNQQMQQQMQNQIPLRNDLPNGFDTPQASEGRYQAETMGKFFTDFHKAQQMRLLLARGEERRHDRHDLPHNMLSAERLEMEHKQRMNNMRANEGMGASAGGAAGAGRAAGDGDDDLDFDPFKETQKALAEMMETEVMLNTISSGDNMERVRRSRLPPPGFSHMNTFGIGVPRHQGHHQDWTQMDPAIMSTSVNFGKAPQSGLSQQQQELFARFNHLQVQPNGVKLPPWPQQKLPWPQHPAPYNAIPLPPGFAPTKNNQHPAECIDAK
ncbi:unnamed protein product, partial [Brenthis ino]